MGWQFKGLLGRNQKVLHTSERLRHGNGEIGALVK